MKSSHIIKDGQVIKQSIYNKNVLTDIATMNNSYNLLLATHRRKSTIFSIGLVIAAIIAVFAVMVIAKFSGSIVGGLPLTISVAVVFIIIASVLVVKADSEADLSPAMLKSFVAENSNYFKEYGRAFAAWSNDDERGLLRSGYIVTVKARDANNELANYDVLIKVQYTVAGIDNVMDITLKFNKEKNVLSATGFDTSVGEMETYP